MIPQENIDTWVSGAMGVLLSIGAWFAGRGKRKASQEADQAAIAEYRADAAVYDASSAQVKSLLDRVDKLEDKYSKLWDELQREKESGAKLLGRVRQLEGILRENHIPVPSEA